MISERRLGCFRAAVVSHLVQAGKLDFFQLHRTEIDLQDSCSRLILLKPCDTVEKLKIFSSSGKLWGETRKLCLIPLRALLALGHGANEGPGMCKTHRARGPFAPRLLVGQLAAEDIQGTA